MNPCIAFGAKKAMNSAEVMRKGGLGVLCLRDTAAVEAIALGADGL